MNEIVDIVDNLLLKKDGSVFADQYLKSSDLSVLYLLPHDNCRRRKNYHRKRAEEAQAQRQARPRRLHQREHVLRIDSRKKAAGKYSGGFCSYFA